MKFVGDLLDKAGKTTFDFLSFLEDGRFNHNLSHLKGKDVVETKQNGGSAKEIHIHEDLMPVLNKFIKE